MAEETITVEELKGHIQMLKNIRQGQEAGRFKFTKLELNAVEVCTEFIEKSIEE